MSHIKTFNITLSNSRNLGILPMDVEALVNTDLLYLTIPDYVRLQLRLEQVSTKEVILANGSKRIVLYVGPIEIRFKNRLGFVGAIVIGDQVLLGIIPMESMDLILNPENPNIP